MPKNPGKKNSSYNNSPISPTGTLPLGTSPLGTLSIGTLSTGTSSLGTSPSGTSPSGTSPIGTSPSGILSEMNLKGYAEKIPEKTSSVKPIWEIHKDNFEKLQEYIHKKQITNKYELLYLYTLLDIEDRKEDPDPNFVKHLPKTIKRICCNNPKSNICKYYKKKEGVTCLNNNLLVNTRVYIYFMRHSESCTNVLKRNRTFGKFKQAFYSDPELSYRGEKMAEDMANKFFAENGPYSRLRGSREIHAAPLLFGASSLLRAQQTARFMRDGRANKVRQNGENVASSSHRYPIIHQMPFVHSNRHPPAHSNKQPIYKMPYIHEIGSGEENREMSPSLREKIRTIPKYKDKVDQTDIKPPYTEENKPSDLKTPNIIKFLDWLGYNLGGIYGNIEGGSNPLIFQMIIVTHHGILKQLMKIFNIKEEFNNLDGIEICVDYNEFGKRINTLKVDNIIRYTPPATIPLSCPEVAGKECRRPVCPMPPVTEEKSICSLIRDAGNNIEKYSNIPTYNVSQNGRRTIKKQSKDKYYSEYIVPIISSIHAQKKQYSNFPNVDTSILEQYKKPGWFSRKARRNQSYLDRDLDKLSIDLDCMGRSPIGRSNSIRNLSSRIPSNIRPVSSSPKNRTPLPTWENMRKVHAALPAAAPVAPPPVVTPGVGSSSIKNNSLLISASKIYPNSTNGGNRNKTRRARK